jgi:hypothetical protein
MLKLGQLIGWRMNLRGIELGIELGIESTAKAMSLLNKPLSKVTQL